MSPLFYRIPLVLHIRYGLQVFGAFARLRKATISFVMSVLQFIRLSVPAGRILMKFDIWVFYRKSIEKFQWNSIFEYFFENPWRSFDEIWCLSIFSKIHRESLMKFYIWVFFRKSIQKFWWNLIFEYFFESPSRNFDEILYLSFFFENPSRNFDEIWYLSIFFEKPSRNFDEI